MSARPPRWRAAGWLLLRCALAAVFLYAGVLKLTAPEPFAASIARFQLLPAFLVNPLALGLPPLEILLGMALLFGPWKRPAALGLVGLCLVFLAALLSAAARGIDVDCSCFGAATAEPLWSLILRDVLLLAIAGALYLKLAPRNLFRGPARRRKGINPDRQAAERKTARLLGAAGPGTPRSSKVLDRLPLPLS